MNLAHPVLGQDLHPRRSLQGMRVLVLLLTQSSAQIEAGIECPVLEPLTFIAMSGPPFRTSQCSK